MGHRRRTGCRSAAHLRRVHAAVAHAGLTEIAAGLNVDAIPTQRGGMWHASTVRYILGNVRYVAIVGEELYQAAQARLATLPMGPTQ